MRNLEVRNLVRNLVVPVDNNDQPEVADLVKALQTKKLQEFSSTSK